MEDEILQEDEIIEEPEESETELRVKSVEEQLAEHRERVQLARQERESRRREKSTPDDE